MREIKYQAWVPRVKRMFDVESMYWRDGKPYHVRANTPDPLGARMDCQPFILREYTGLKDKNGTEIFEGDVIRWGFIAFNDTAKYGEGCWDNLPDGIKEDDISTVLGQFEVTWLNTVSDIKRIIEMNPDVIMAEVIGNIYENPELLEAE